MKLFNYLIIAVTLCLFAACDNELEPFEELKDIPIVYGILSAEDTANYIRVERAFLTQGDESAIDVAKIADSLYYDNATVTLTEEATQTVYPLVRVNGTDEGYIREPGTFATDPNYLYKLKLPDGQSLDRGTEYTLTVDRNNGTLPAVSTTTLLDTSMFTLPIKPASFPSVLEQLALSSASARRINFRTVENAYFYDLYILFSFEEETTAGSGIYEERTVRLPIADNLVGEEGATLVMFTYNGLEFFEELGNVLEPGPDRKLLPSQYLGFEVVAVGDEIEDYITLLRANTGLTSAEVVPQFSNIENGLGIFTSSSTARYVFFKFNDDSIDELRTNPATSSLGF